MNRDQFAGLLIFILSIAFLLAYVWLALFSPWTFLIVQLTVVVLVAIFLGVIAWIGYTIATTPPPKPVEEIEKELEEELKKIES